MRPEQCLDHIIMRLHARSGTARALSHKAAVCVLIKDYVLMNFGPAGDSRVLLPLNLRESVGKLVEREKAKVRVGAGRDCEKSVFCCCTAGGRVKNPIWQDDKTHQLVQLLLKPFRNKHLALIQLEHRT